MDCKRVLVIGGGCAGLVSIVQLKAEGIEPVCYERSENFGGTWCYRKETMYAQASIMSTTIINHCKEIGAFSNFPPRKELNNFMKHTEMYQYINDYCKYYNCEKYIHYRMEVIGVRKADDYESTGKWRVTTKKLATEEEITEIFDGVFVGTGHINMPTVPTYPGQDIFTGKIMHTHSLKEVDEFKNKTVVVVGIGCSALDAAVGISRVAKQVYLSSRTGAFVWNRFGRNGCPIDYTLFRRYLTFLLNILPTNFLSWYLESFYADQFFDHRLYYLKPKYHILSRDPILNDHFAAKLLSGTVILKGDVKGFTERSVFFENEEIPTQVDSVVMATGYTWGYPFLEDNIITTEKGAANLYKCMYPVQLPHPTLAIIGFLLPYGPGLPIGELQIRWACYLLTGRGKLPSKDVMMNEVRRRNNENVERYIPGEKLSIRVDYVQYMDEIAEEMRVKPNFFKIFTYRLPFIPKTNVWTISVLSIQA